MTAVFRATYSDWRVIKGRKVVQVVFETPIEQADLAYKVVGGMPNPAEEKWFAIARLTEQSGQAPRQEPTQLAPAGAPKSYAQRIALLCKEGRFRAYLNERFTVTPSRHVHDEAAAADLVRNILNVVSRGDVNEMNPEAVAKWRKLSADYDAWVREPA